MSGSEKHEWVERTSKATGKDRHHLTICNEFATSQAGIVLDKPDLTWQAHLDAVRCLHLTNLDEAKECALSELIVYLTEVLAKMKEMFAERRQGTTS